MMNIVAKEDIFQLDYCLNHSTSENYCMDFHFHDVYEIYYSISGGQNFIINNQIYDIQPGDLFIMNNAEIHKTTTIQDKPYERYVFVFKPAYITSIGTVGINLLECFTKRPKGFSHKIHLTASQQHFIMTHFKKYEFIEGYGKDALELASLIELLVFVNSIFLSAVPAAPIAEFSEYYSVLKPLIDYIHGNLTGNLSLDELSNHFHMSKFYMCELFKKHTGSSINNYVTARRIVEAKCLLKKHLSVTDVCEQAGFNDYCHFIRTFTKLVGISPKKYAKKI